MDFGAPGLANGINDGFSAGSFAARTIFGQTDSVGLE